MKTKYYILKNKKVIEVDSAYEWSGSGLSHKRVALSEFGPVCVSTIFTGLDMRCGGEGAPLVFETMIFGGEHDQYQERYATWKEARAGHMKACQFVIFKQEL